MLENDPFLHFAPFWGLNSHIGHGMPVSPSRRCRFWVTEADIFRSNTFIIDAFCAKICCLWFQRQITTPDREWRWVWIHLQAPIFHGPPLPYPSTTDCLIKCVPWKVVDGTELYGAIKLEWIIVLTPPPPLVLSETYSREVFYIHLRWIHWWLEHQKHISGTGIRTQSLGIRDVALW